MEVKTENLGEKQDPITTDKSITHDANMEMLIKFNRQLESSFLIGNNYFGLYRMMKATLARKFKNADDFTVELYKETRIQFDKVFPEKITELQADFKSNNKKLNDMKNQIEFLKSLSIKGKLAESYLPDTFFENKLVRNDDFPSSLTDCSKTLWSANSIGNLILAAGPANKTLEIPLIADAFFEFIFETKANYILGLGDYGVDFDNYTKPGIYGTEFRYIVTAENLFDDEELKNFVTGKKITVKNKSTNESHSFVATNIMIGDHRGLHPDYNAAFLINILANKIRQKKEKFIIHCSAGVGRTGMIASILLTLADTRAKKLLSSITEAFIKNNSINPNESDEILEILINKICQIRKIRPAIATTSQLACLNDNLMLLTAVENKLINEKNFDTMVNRFALSLLPKTPLRIINAETEIKNLKNEINQLEATEKEINAVLKMNEELTRIINDMRADPFHGGGIANIANKVVTFLGVSIHDKKLETNESEKKSKPTPGINNTNRLNELCSLNQEVKLGWIRTVEEFKKKFEEIFQYTRDYRIFKESTRVSKLYPSLEKFRNSYFKDEQIDEISSLPKEKESSSAPENHDEKKSETTSPQP